MPGPAWYLVTGTPPRLELLRALISRLRQRTEASRENCGPSPAGRLETSRLPAILGEV